MAKQRSMYGKDDLYVTDRSSPNATRVTDVQKWRTNQDDIRHLPGALPMQKLAIQDGAIGPSAAFVIVDTEGGAPADDLTAINPGDLHDGMEIELISADSSRVITIKNSTAFSGIRTIRGEDLVLGMFYSLRLKLVSTESITYWQELPATVKISDSVSFEDSNTAASAKAVKTAYDATNALRSEVPALAAHAAMPLSGNRISVSAGIGETFTAPDDGWIEYLLTTATIGAFARFDITGRAAIFTPFSSGSGQFMYLLLPISQGETITFSNFSGVASGGITCNFIYANGAV